ncbi:DUF2026 family protein [Vibrio parahaemolyticus]|nr:DUF2026 family protein [Vibrio parahaemolyticus]
MKITLPDYFRIYSIMHSVLKSENADTNKSCSFYNYCGAYILNEHYKLPRKYILVLLRITWVGKIYWVLAKWTVIHCPLTAKNSIHGLNWMAG